MDIMQQKQNSEKFNRFGNEGPDSGELTPESFHILHIVCGGSQQWQKITKLMFKKQTNIMNININMNIKISN